MRPQPKLLTSQFFFRLLDEPLFVRRTDQAKTGAGAAATQQKGKHEDRHVQFPKGVWLCNYFIGHGLEYIGVLRQAVDHVDSLPFRQNNKRILGGSDSRARVGTAEPILGDRLGAGCQFEGGFEEEGAARAC
jgi:hypothetical protein